MRRSHPPEVPADDRELELRRLASIVEDSQDAIIGKDLTGRITSWNRAAEQMFGYPAQEIVDQPVLLLFPERLRSEEAMIINRLRKGEHIDHYETQRLHKDGREIEVALTVSPIRAAGGEVVGASKILRDITEAKLMRRELEALRGELSHVSRLNDMGQMATALAHELNQPLAAISMYVAGVLRLLDRGDVENAKVGCVKAADQVERAGGIIRRLRDFVAKREATRRREDLRDVIHEAAGLALLEREGVDLTVRIADDARHAVIDRVQIQQVLMNLIRNALEAMAQEPARRIAVSARRGDPERVEIEVADSGPGLAPEVLERLFQPFTTTKSEGMGVGLSLCRTIVETEGGHIAGGNGETGGAWFRFTVPAG